MTNEERQRWIDFLSEHETPKGTPGDYGLKQSAFLKAVRIAKAEGAAEQRKEIAKMIQERKGRRAYDAHALLMGVLLHCENSGEAICAQGKGEVE